ncbi:MAG: S41 family peptidase [Planctomycetota bacterium]
MRPPAALAFAPLVLGGVAAAAPPDATPPDAMLSGRVTDAAGEPIAGATVALNNYERVRLAPLFPPPATTGAGGRYTLPLGFADGADPATPVVVKQLFVEAPGFVRDEARRRLPLLPGESATLDFTLIPGEVLAGRIETPPGDRRPSPFVEIIDAEGRSRTRLADDDGRFETWLPPGVYTVKARGPMVRGRMAVLVAEGVRTGRRDVVVRLAERELAAVTPDLLRGAFDTLWTAMDERYSYFFLKQDLDWRDWRTRHEPDLVASDTIERFSDRLAEALAELRDPHITIETPDGHVGTFGVPYRGNWNPRAGAKTYIDPVDCGGFAFVGRTPEGFGYVVMNKQSRATPDRVRQTVEEIGRHADAPGFLVDLRGGASGGSEPLATELARAFCAEPVVYARHKYRSGPGHDDFGNVNDRVLPAGDTPYTRPVVCLIGHRCMSSGEALVLMMKALPHVTTVGDSTRGASGNPKPVGLPGLDLAVWFSTWVAMAPDGEPFEGVGIPPDIRVDAPPEAYRDADPTLDRALEVLRERVAASAAR